jgi:hypothetical protein
MAAPVGVNARAIAESMQSHTVVLIEYALSRLMRYALHRRNVATFAPIPNLCGTCYHTSDCAMTLRSCRVNEVHSPARLSQTEVDGAFGLNADRRVGLPGTLAAGESCHEDEGPRQRAWASTAGFGARAGSGGHQVLWGPYGVCGCGGCGPVERSQL